MDYELMFWIVSAIIGVVAFGVMCFLGKKESENYVDLEKWK